MSERFILARIAFFLAIAYFLFLVWRDRREQISMWPARSRVVFYGSALLMVVNVDHDYTQAGWLHLDLESLGLDPEEPYRVHDLLTESRYTWRGPHNYVELNPHVVPAHVFRIRQRGRGRTEQDFEYFA